MRIMPSFVVAVGLGVFSGVPALFHKQQPQQPPQPSTRPAAVATAARSADAGPAGAAARVEGMVTRAAAFLVRRQQPDGSWQGGGDPTYVTSVGVMALTQARAAANRPPVPDGAALAAAVGGQADGPFGRRLRAAADRRRAGEPVVRDADGKAHDWRADVVADLAASQQPDGHWAGGPGEEDEVLATAYAVLTLTEVRADLAAHPPAP